MSRRDFHRRFLLPHQLPTIIRHQIRPPDIYEHHRPTTPRLATEPSNVIFLVFLFHGVILLRILDFTTDGDSPEDSGNLRRRLSQSYADIIHAIDALQSQNNTLLELVEYLKRMHPTLVTPDLIPTLTEDLQSLLTQFTSLTHTSLASQLTSNQTYLTSVSLDDFVAVYKETHKFVVDCEVRCKCMVVAL
ncbi:hypothetical protein PM082_023948 [Marasmius tenuissimus]|nr:hypothetical protein PM082_023948 [Marasmius tenuissimus]